MKTFTIDLEKCNKDGICALDCPTNVIQQDSPDEVPHPSQDFEDYCLECGHCTAVCPTGAFSLDWLSHGQCKPIHKELVLSEQQTEQFLRSRRSIRHFKDKAVEGDKLEKLLEIACYAPTAKNNQPWHWIVVHCEKKYGFGAEDSALALSYLELYAPAIGLGSCWGGYFYSAVNAYPKLFEALGLPADHRACGAVMVGYPQLRYQRMPLRKKPRVQYL